MKEVRETIKKLPSSPGVYLFMNEEGEVIYVGKAGNIKRRVASYFSSKEKRAVAIAEKIKKINFEETETVIEALIREADLIKKHRPDLNIKDNDDRSFLYVLITKENYPRVLLVRGKDLDNEEGRSIFGPFVFASEIKEALKIIRKIFPYSTHTEKEIKKGKSCFYHQIGLCPGTCSGKIDKKEYLKNIKNIESFFSGKKKKIISSLKKEMEKESEKLNFEKAEEIKRKIKALSFIQETALLKKRTKQTKGPRIEGYDVSNISGEHAVGAMVVFSGDVPEKKEYRLFKIKNEGKKDDTQMIAEIIERRFNNDWSIPELILVDGGKGQVSAAKKVLEKKELSVPVVGIAKGEKRRGELLIGDLPAHIKKETLLSVQKESHRFAITYHRKIRKKDFLK